MNLKKVLLIINPVSGQLKAEKALPDMLELYRQHNIDVCVEKTHGRFDAKKITMEKGAGFDAVICAGGDGTLNEVICGIIDGNLDIPIGYIPSGTTNDFASSIGIPGEVREAVLTTINGTPSPFDIGKFGDRYFTYIASFGAFTETSYATPQKMKNKIGHAAYILGCVKDLFANRHYRVRVTADGHSYEDSYMFGAVCNTYSIGGVFNLDPKEVDMSDGIYEIVIAKKAGNPFTVLKRVIDFNNHRYPSDTIKCFKAKNVRFECESGLDWSLDGEHAHGDSDITVYNLYRRINLIRK